MKVLFCSTHPLHTADFLADFQAALPAVEFIHWREDMPTQGAELAVIFQPPDALYAREPGLRAVFNLGAGVDALLRNPAFPSSLALYRLEDGGMSAQIAEYVVHAVSRIVRQLDRYAEQEADRHWHQLTAIDRREFRSACWAWASSAERSRPRLRSWTMPWRDGHAAGSRWRGSRCSAVSRRWMPSLRAAASW